MEWMALKVDFGRCNDQGEQGLPRTFSKKDPKNGSTASAKTCCSFLEDVRQFYSDWYSSAQQAASEINPKRRISASAASTKGEASSAAHLELTVISHVEYLERGGEECRNGRLGTLRATRGSKICSVRRRSKVQCNNNISGGNHFKQRN